MNRPWGTADFFRRSFRLRYLSELPSSVQRRLHTSSLMLREEEDRVRELMGLWMSPRLSLVDEESGSLVTGSERKVLEDQRDQESRRAKSEASDRDWRGGR